MRFVKRQYKGQSLVQGDVSNALANKIEARPESEVPPTPHGQTLLYLILLLTIENLSNLKPC